MGCPRRAALRVRGRVTGVATGPPWLSEGQWHEEEIIDRLKRIGFRLTQTGKKEGWFTLRLAGLRIRGQVDGVLPEVPAVLEIKSVGTEHRLANEGKPRDSWRYQAEVYMRALELPYTLLFAKARETGWARQWYIRRDDELWERIQERAQSIRDTTDPWAIEVRRSPECGYCPFRHRCWGEEPEVEVLL